MARFDELDRELPADADFDTPAELCAIAHSYLDTDGNGSNGLRVGITLREQFDAIVDTKTVRAAEDVEGHSFEGNSATHSFYFTVPRVHDWCYAWLTTMERDDLEDSFETFTMASACEVDAAYKQPITNQGDQPYLGGRNIIGIRILSMISSTAGAALSEWRGADLLRQRRRTDFRELPGGRNSRINVGRRKFRRPDTNHQLYRGEYAAAGDRHAARAHRSRP